MTTIRISATKPQHDFHALTCKHPAFVAGFGSGKSETMLNQAIIDSSASSSSLIGIYEPTYDLVRLIVAPRLEQKLHDFGISYKYNKSENIVYTSSPNFGDFVLRTLDNPSRIVGYETYRAHIDEIDTLSEDKAREAWIKILARNRQAPLDIEKPFNRVSVYTTPEGFRFVYKTWKKNPKPDYEMIQASTLSNPYLPEDYVDALRAAYPEQLIDAYINGEFVNLTSGTVYNNYDRKLNDTNREWNGKEPVFIGMDFNVGQMAAVVHVKDPEGPRAVDEISNGYDTPDMIRLIKERYRDCSIRVYPDASGGSRKSVDASKTDIALLEQAGFSVIYNKKNPFVKDRVLSMNLAFCNNSGERSYLVNANKCPNYADCLEQQVWADNGEPDKKAGNDHMNDAGGYFVSFEYPIIKPAISMPITFAM